MKSIFLIMMVSLPVFAGQLAQDSAHGLSCRYPPDIKEEFRYSDAIFLGKAITKEYAPGIQPDIPEYAKTKFQVIESFKGPVSDTLTIRSDERTWGFVFTENTEYVVFADEQDGHLWHQLCSPTGTPDSVDLYQIRKIAQKYVAPPLKQLSFGTPIEQIKCKEGLELIQKSSDGSPACVKTETKSELIERGWAKYNSHNAIYDKSDFDRIQIENRGMENQTCFGIYSNETRVSIACDMVTHGGSPVPFKPETKIQCQGNRMCLTEVVTRVVDGDTIHITGGHKIRLSLTNTPEVYEAGFYKATQFTENLCPVGSKVIVDQDDVQPYDAYDRLLGKVICDDKILNAELLYNGHANILTQYCKTSEFSKEKWAEEFGC